MTLPLNCGLSRTKWTRKFAAQTRHTICQIWMWWNTWKPWLDLGAALKADKGIYDTSCMTSLTWASDNCHSWWFVVNIPHDLRQAKKLSPHEGSQIYWKKLKLVYRVRWRLKKYIHHPWRNFRWEVLYTSARWWYQYAANSTKASFGFAAAISKYQPSWSKAFLNLYRTGICNTPFQEVEYVG